MFWQFKAENASFAVSTPEQWQRILFSRYFVGISKRTELILLSFTVTKIISLFSIRANLLSKQVLCVKVAASFALSRVFE